MLSIDTSSLAKHLSNNSVPYKEPISRVNWRALNHTQFWLPEAAISLFGTPEYNSLTDTQRKNISHQELLHLIEFGLWLEGIFIKRLCTSDLISETSLSIGKYCLFEIQEEIGHSLMFLRFIEQCGYARVPINRKMLTQYEKFWSLLSIKSSLFWTFVLAGEEIPLRMNRFMLREKQGLNQTVLDIVKIHTIDESRHVSHANAMVIDTLKSANTLSKLILRFLVPKLIKRFTEVFFYPMPEIYSRAGLPDNIDWAKIARQNPTRHKFVHQQLENTLRPLHQDSII
ncbi:MAG: diiron oxygenase [Thiohalomonadales bacterium]